MTAPLPAAQARYILDDAFTRFERTVDPRDRRVFHDTKLQDVKDEAVKMEKELLKKRTHKNMMRLQPFLRGIDRYSKVMDILCNGTPYLSWIWAPVKLMLTIAFDTSSAFEKLIDAYGKIAAYLPRLDRLNEVLKGDPNFYTVLALVYKDIMEFHRRAYKFVKMKSWATFFASMWDGFETRFAGILQNLAYHQDLLDREANAINISESLKRHKDHADKWAKQELEWSKAYQRHREDTDRWAQQELEWHAVKIRAVLNWLQIDGASPEETYERICDLSLPDSCDWFIEQDVIREWRADGSKNALVWLTGKPGAGKSVICSNMIRHAEAHKLDVFYHFCSYLGDSSESFTRLLRSLASQIVGKHQDLAMFLYKNYVQRYPNPTKKIILNIIPELLGGIGSARVIVDGLDEWNISDQRGLLEYLPRILSTDANANICKTMISSRVTLDISRSRDTLDISKSLLKKIKPTAISLSDERERVAVDRSIARFVDAELARRTTSRFNYLDPDGKIMLHIKQGILEKSNGMFLWARLVLDSLEFVYSPEDLSNVVDTLPEDLEDLYKQIFSRLCNKPGAQRWGGVPRIVSWVCHARRPLHKYEVLHALSVPAIDPSSTGDVVPAIEILDHCKPLVEERPDGTLAFVHFSVKEFLLKNQTSPIISPNLAQLDFASVSITLLIRGLALLDPATNQVDRLRNVASCTYRLLPYALEFWTEHCLRYGSPGTPFRAHQVILDQLARLDEMHQSLVQLAYTDVVSANDDMDTSEIHLDERIGFYGHFQAHTLIRKVLYDRALALQSNLGGHKNSTDASAREDVTLFNKMRAALDQATVHLMSHAIVPGISEDMLRAFRECHASAAFLCRFSNCDSSSIGYVSDELRKQHEASHIRHLYCNVASCTRSRIGFDKKATLDRHIKKCHSEELPLPVPPRIRTSGQNKTISAPSEDENKASFSENSYNSQRLPQHVGPGSGPPGGANYDHFVNHYRTQQQQGKIPQGWQQSVAPEERGRLAFRFFTQYRLFKPDGPELETMRSSLQFETRVFVQSQTRDQYVSNIKQKLLQLTAARQQQGARKVEEGDQVARLKKIREAYQQRLQRQAAASAGALPPGHPMLGGGQG